jgi:AraC family transcriptional regulator of adaptative response/methylated-DNA-[protein]-cysteine methyltransferase
MERKNMLPKHFWLQNGSELRPLDQHASRHTDQSVIEYGFVSTSLGDCLAAFSTQGLCWFEPVATTDTPDQLLAYWQPAMLSRADKSIYRRLEEYVRNASMPLHLSGTQFQLKVWSALLDTVPGAPLTYAELGGNIGMPQAARAVGSAVAANHIALFVPCHRIVPAAGGAGEYRWGSHLKSRLLEVEADQAANCLVPGENSERKAGPQPGN